MLSKHTDNLAYRSAHLECTGHPRKRGRRQRIELVDLQTF